MFNKQVARESQASVALVPHFDALCDNLFSSGFGAGPKPEEKVLGTRLHIQYFPCFEFTVQTFSFLYFASALQWSYSKKSMHSQTEPDNRSIP